MFENLKKDENIEQKDTLGGGSGPLDSGLYIGTVDMAYLEKTAGGATMLNLNLVMANGQKKNFSTCILKKDGDHTWSKNGNSGYMPGYEILDAMAAHIGAGDITKLPAPETKTITVYDWNERKEVPAEREVVMSILNKKFAFGIMLIMEDKYQNEDYWVVKNEINKVFNAETGNTRTEMEAGLTEGAFIKKWEEANSGRTVDKRNKSKDGIQWDPKTQNAESGDSSGGDSVESSTPSLFAANAK